MITMLKTLAVPHFCHPMLRMTELWLRRICVLVTFFIASAIAASSTEIRHDRLCDRFQDDPGKWPLNPQGGNAILFGGCTGIQDLPVGKPWYRAIWWNAYNCGYEAYRDNTKRNENPYLNEALNERWAEGWDAAAKACEMGVLPFGMPANP